MLPTLRSGMVELFPIFTCVWAVNLETWFYRINQNILIKCHLCILYAVEIETFSKFLHWNTV